MFGSPGGVCVSVYAVADDLPISGETCPVAEGKEVWTRKEKITVWDWRVTWGGCVLAILKPWKEELDRAISRRLFHFVGGKRNKGVKICGALEF